MSEFKKDRHSLISLGLHFINGENEDWRAERPFQGPAELLLPTMKCLLGTNPGVILPELSIHHQYPQ